MANKRKEAKAESAPQRPAVKRRRQAPAGRIARRRDPVDTPAPPLALDEHSVQVREQIEAALFEALRMREDIEQRIEQGLHEHLPRRVVLPARTGVVSSTRTGSPGRARAQK
ncbi:hypothetical protein BON30_11700 [Cystobacter ferrugineus]|uniref:Uncharacterized protein n=2 Tax=Cystobacter ferrugineus TaxID=83449 RepID=A0A1L9BGX9_9BACT|nr:hypothetical protein BON30_11700 [Cystobacter ferrugineus]